MAKEDRGGKVDKGAKTPAVPPKPNIVPTVRPTSPPQKPATPKK